MERPEVIAEIGGDAPERGHAISEKARSPPLIGLGYFAEGSGYFGEGSGYLEEGSGYFGEGSGYFGEGSGYLGEG
ncbi:MAG: hypothetical protein U0441_05405 [Polyangiaceae bacterium]